MERNTNSLRRRTRSDKYPDSMSPTYHKRSRSASKSKGDQQSTREDFEEYFNWMNERRVNDVVLDLFYKPHTLTLLACVICVLIYMAFTADGTNTENNIWLGCKTALFLFLTISLLVFPNGPFTRPHPAVWRMAFGVSVAYLIILVVILFQNFKDIKRILKWIDPERLNKLTLEEKEYAQNCSDLTFARVWDACDIFVFAHFFGWAMKALLLRHTFILWYISISWELTEILFSHLLPNFKECWWDAIILDVLLANGLGIFVGMYIARKLEMRQYRWESIRNLKSTRAKIKRAVLQFTPESWMEVNWLDADSSGKRCIQIFVIVLIWQIIELNTFFLKHIFAIDTNHPLVSGRILLIGMIGAPTIRQYYLYITDPRANRLGTQCWIFVAVALTEAIICVKFGKEVFALTQIWTIIGWFAMLVIGAILCVYISVEMAKRSDYTVQKNNSDGKEVHEYIDDSTENIPGLFNLAGTRKRPSNKE